MKHGRAAATLACLAVFGVAGCEESIFDTRRPDLTVVTVCERIDFDQFAHGDLVTSVSALGMTLTVTADPWLEGDRPVPLKNARAYDTNNVDGPDNDLEWQGTLPECPNCQGQNRVLVIEDVRGWDLHGDDRTGGALILTGFTFPVYLQSFKAFDNEGLAHAAPEVPITASVDGFVLAGSTGQGNGSVETVNAPAQVLFNNELRFTLGDGILVNGSGAVDDIVLCKEEDIPDGGEGCTPGYWKTHNDQAPGNQGDAWIPTGYMTSTLLSAVFAVPASLQDLNGDGNPDTLLDALNFTGGAGVAGGARILLRAAVASLLNASHPDVGFDMTTAEIIAQVDAALASGNKATMIALAEQLDILNNQGCPLD